MTWFERNSLPDIIELVVDRAVSDSSIDQATPLAVELRAASHELKVGDSVVIVGFSKVWLILLTDGVDVVPGRRLGEPVVEINSRTTNRLEKSSETAAKGGGSLALDVEQGVPQLSVHAGASGAASKKQTSITEDEKVSLAVIAKPNQRWVVTSGSATSSLEGTYIQGEPLCQVSPVAGSNRKSVSILVVANKNDMTFSENHSESSKSIFSIKGRKSVNREKVFGVLLGKLLSDGIETGENSMTVSEVGNCFDD